MTPDGPGAVFGPESGGRTEDQVDLEAGPNATGSSERNGTGSQVMRVAALLVGLLGAGIVALLLLADPLPDSRPSPLVGRVVPDLTGTTLDGGRFDIDDHRGQWVIVNMFATWCVPCQVEHPELVAFDDEHATKGDAQLVSVVFGDDDDSVREFFAERGGEWPVLGEQYSSLIVDFGSTGVPETFVVAPSGLVVERFLGGVTKDGLNAVIDAYSQ